MANGGSCDRRIIDFIEYLIDRASGDGGVGVGPSGNWGVPLGGPPDKGGTSSSSSSSSVDSLTTSKKN